MFKIYDLNMKEITLPKGVMPLEIFVGSVAKNRVTEAIDGRVGVVDYGFNYTDRPVSLFLRIKAADKIDFRLLRNEVFATFDVGSAFYVAESDVPSRVLKVVVDESYIPDRLTEEYADFDINCRTLDSVFWESKYTTLELHDSGYSATAEKYGLVDNIDDEKVQYRFEPDLDVISFDNPNAWEMGGINSTTGALIDDDNNIRTKNFISIVPGKEYTIKETLDTPNLRQWWAMEYDSSDNFVGWVSTPFSGPVERTFIARGSKLKLRSSMISGNTITPSDVGVITIPELTSKASINTFTVYNAGNVTIEPESMLLNIIVNAVRSDNNFTIRNITTGEEIILKRASFGSHFRIRGMVFSFGSFTNIFRDTNRRFVSLVPGDNQFEILNGTFEEIRFEFKYYYK